MSLLLPASSICFSALFKAVGFTGALPLRCMAAALAVALWARLCARFPVIVGGVLLLGGESGVGVCASSSSKWQFEGSGNDVASASVDAIVCYCG
jgi:hypothetical protein